MSFPQPGESVGPYRIDGRLGAGGMGEVYAATDETLQRPVALKVIAPELAGDAEFRERFLREARALAALDSPHVVEVYAAGEAEGLLYLATRLMPDGDLGRWLRDHGPADVATGLGLLRQVATGLADAHAAGFVHRDIKPANVLLRRRGEELQASLADFGIARRTGSDLTATDGRAMGTTGYMAPELHRGEPASVASDIYALGCLLWVTLTGRPPYAGETEFQVITGHLQEPVPQLAGSTSTVRALNRLLARSMAKRPADRYADVPALIADLDAVPTAGVEPATVPHQPVAPRTGRRIGVVLAAVLVVVLLGGGAWALSRHGGGRHPGSASGAGSTGTTTGTTPTPSSTASASASGSPAAGPAAGTAATDRPSGPFGAADVAKAKASVTAYFSTRYSATQSACMAKTWVDQAGVAALVADGIFDARWHFHDMDISKLSARVRDGLTAAGLECATS